MTVQEAREIARNVVLQRAKEMPDFYGAVFHGSMNELPDNHLFPENSDVDVLIVCGHAIPESSGKFIQDGLLLDIGYLPAHQLGSAQKVLSTYYLAGSFRSRAIIADVSGNLTRLQEEVARDFAKRLWVRKRCNNAADRVLRFLEQSDTAELLPDQVMNWLFAKGVLTHILLAAGLKNPTVRKRYYAVHQLLAEYGLLNFHEILLDSLGCATMGSIRVEDQLASLTRIFDSSKSLRKTAQPFTGDISDAARNLAIEGGRQLIESGFHREAVFWIIATYSRCMKILWVDAPVLYQASLEGYQQLLREVKIFSREDLRSGNEETRELLSRVMEMAEVIMRQNPQIRD